MKRAVGFIGIVFLLTVFGFGGQVVCAQSPDTVVVDSVLIHPGDTGVRVPVYGYVGDVNGENLDAVNFGLSYDRSVLTCDTILYNVSDAGEECFYNVISNPFMFTPRIYTDTNWVTVGIVFSMTGATDIPLGHYRMFDLVFDVSEDAQPGCYALHIDDEAGNPPIGNYFTHNVTVEYYEKVDGKLCVEELKYGSISGTVTSAATGVPIDGALVIAGGRSSVTWSSGIYQIDSLLVGTYDVIAKGPACVPDTIEGVEVEEDSVTAGVNFSVTPLDSVFIPDTINVKRNVEFKIPVWGKISGVESGDSLLDLDAITFTVGYDGRFLIVDSVLYTCDSIFYGGSIVYSPDGQIISGEPMYFPRLCDVVPEGILDSIGMWSPNIHNSENWARVGVIFDIWNFENDIPPGKYHFFDFYCHMKYDGSIPFLIGDDFGTPPMPILFTYQGTNSHPYYNGEGCLCPVTMAEQGEELPKEFSLHQNYPNPFNMETVIRYELPNRVEVTLDVYNLLGEKVKTLVHQVQDPGYYTAFWDGTDQQGSKVSSGVYFYRLGLPNQGYVGRMLLLK